MSLRLLNNVSGVYLVQVSFLIGQQGLARGLCKLCVNTREKLQIQRQPLLVQYKQQANAHLSMHNYTLQYL